ncbi:MAG: hypothetical protein HeimC3_17400 [Candidatus Heimdallarchaeota archaeon LC_3]|nr:MAG: hypothetical protein HeimC3_17400 [Candidatus Heimdallarchaeota archaeon LC_3]
MFDVSLDPQRELVIFHMNNPNENNELLFKHKKKQKPNFPTDNRMKLIIFFCLVMVLSFLFALLLASPLRFWF